MAKLEGKKEEKEVLTENEVSQYFYAVGRRKTAIAQVRFYPSEKAEGKNVTEILVNDKKFEEYFPINRLRDSVKAPLATASQEGKCKVTAKVYGGGVTAQAEAVRLGIARALVKFNEELKKSLSDRGFLTRDARVVERKKAGLKKARRSPQWAKR